MTSGGQAPRGPRRDPERGDLIGGHRIERPLGAGAMGTVWLAEHVTLGRRVALKILAHGLAHDPSFQERFMREARLAARLEHPNVVAVYDAGTDPAGLWLSMRYVEGEDLRRRLHRLADARGVARGTVAGPRTLSSSPFRRPSADEADPTIATTGAAGPPGGLPPEEAVRVVRGVAAGLDHAHSRGVLHRDVKPGNVLLETAGAPPRDPGAPDEAAPRSGDAALPPFGGVLLADFGLTKELEEGTDLTQTGMLLGSADSVAPEQIEGREADRRIDVYALASLLYVALTGESPFPGTTMAKLFAHVNGERPRPGDLFPELRPFDAVVAAGMAKDPDDRPASAGELADLAQDALERLDVDPQATVAFPAPTPPRDRRPPPRPRPTPPAPGVPLAPRLRDDTAAGLRDDTAAGLRDDAPARPRAGSPVSRGWDDEPTSPRTRVAPAPRAADPGGARGAAAWAEDPGRRAGPAPGGPGAAGPGGPTGPDGNGRPWLVPALVVGTLVLAVVVVLALALRGGGDDPDRGTPEADGTTTRTTRTATSTAEAPSTGTSTAEAPAGEDPPATTAGTPPADAETPVDGGGTLAAGAATRDPETGQPLAGSGTGVDYVAPDGAWRTLLVRPGDGWEAPTRSMRGSALERVRQAGPGGRLLLVDHTPSQAATFDTANVLETRTISGTAFGDRPAYRFKDGRIGSIPECARLQCIDVPLNQGDRGPGWGVLVAAPTAAEAWATVERVVRSTGP